MRSYFSCLSAHEIENQAWIAGWGGHQNSTFRTPPPRPITPRKHRATSPNGNVNIISTLFDLQRKRKRWSHPLARLGASSPSRPPPIQKATRAKERKENSGESYERISKPSLNGCMPNCHFPGTTPSSDYSSKASRDVTDFKRSHRFHVIRSPAKEKEVTPPTLPITHPQFGVIHLLHGAPPIQKATRAKERKEKQKKQVRDRELTK